MFRVVHKDIWCVCAWKCIVKFSSQTLIFLFYLFPTRLHTRFEWTALHHNAVFVAFFFWLLHLHFTELYKPFSRTDTLERGRRVWLTNTEWSKIKALCWNVLFILYICKHAQTKWILQTLTHTGNHWCYYWLPRKSIMFCKYVIFPIFQSRSPKNQHYPSFFFFQATQKFWIINRVSLLVKWMFYLCKNSKYTNHSKMIH